MIPPIPRRTAGSAFHRRSIAPRRQKDRGPRPRRVSCIIVILPRRSELKPDAQVDLRARGVTAEARDGRWRAW